MTTDTVGGVWSYCVELCRELAQRGVEVALATMGAPLSAEQRRAATELASGRVKVQVYESSYRLEWMPDPWGDVDRAGQWLRDLDAAIAPDVVHLNGYCHGDLPWTAPVLVVAHSCVLSWWRAVKGCDAPGEWATYRRRVARGLAAADAIAAPTRAMGDEIERLYAPPRPVRVIPNGRSPARAVPARQEPFIFSAGRFWDQAKNLAALAACSETLPWPVYIAGDTRHPGGGDAAAEVRGTRGLHLLGALSPPAVAEWQARAAIYALPARYEPFGLSALEAALAGCALVLGDIASLREVWGDAAVFVPPGDFDALGRALGALIHDDDDGDGARRAALARRARERALELTPARMAGAYLDTYEQLVRQRARS